MPLPDAITHQPRLQTLNIHSEPGIDFPDLGIKLWPLFLDPENGVWVMYARYQPGVRLPKHYHTGQVHFFTTKGAWNYLEHPEDVQTAGSYLYEPAGAVHSFNVKPDAAEAMEGFMVIHGVNVTFDDDDAYLGIDSAASFEQMILAAAKAQGIDMPRYLKPSRK